MPKPCPFCGAVLRPVMDHSGKIPTAYAHPGYQSGSRCWAAGYSIGVERLEVWDMRAPSDGPRLAFEVIDGFPLVNDQGQGEPLTVELLNEFIAYYQSQIRGLQQG
ncbi:MAG: hypothetical protein CMK92_13645 [Pseudomonas sp.]|nr:hypothetical protein [Pseudomonas sp.]